MAKPAKTAIHTAIPIVAILWRVIAAPNPSVVSDCLETIQCAELGAPLPAPIAFDTSIQAAKPPAHQAFTSVA
jgi:hypothetical protein